jgi:hypothetical protein
MFKKFRKSTIGFVMSICPPAWNSSAPTGQRELEFYDFSKSFEKVQI